MPRRPSRLILTHPGTHIPLYPSFLAQPPSPHSTLAVPRIPLIPPPRLYLRTIIPSPPLSPAFLSTTPNRPYPWIWRCHLCHSVYQLGVTRRCLEDGHLFCNLPTPSPSPDESYATDAEMRISGAGKKRKRRRKQVKGCRAEFDYAGWSRNNIWRRETAVVKAGRRGEEVVTKVGSKDCWNECDFPSECHNHRSSLSVETGRSLRQRILIEVEVEGPDQVGDVGWETHVGAHLGQEPSLADLWKELDTERRGQEDEAKLMNVDLELQIGGLPVDYDLPHEEGCQLEYRKPKRKNSIQMIQQLTGLMLGSTDVDMGGESPPSSPLKTAFSVEDEDELIESGRELELDDDGGDLGCCTDCEERIQVCHVEDREVVDVQMEELLQTRTMFLSQFDGDQWDRLI